MAKLQRERRTAEATTVQTHYDLSHDGAPWIWKLVDGYYPSAGQIVDGYPVADCLKREVSSLGPVRSSLIAKGMIWSPSHGDTAFTVPLFDEFMRRIMPSEDWRT